MVAIACVALASCAAPDKSPAPGAAPATSWSGRLSVRVEGDQTQSFFAAFELNGNASSGELRVFSPFGATLARLTWSAGSARLLAQGRDESFASIAELTRSVTGTELPVASLFRWLVGEGAAEGGWAADLSQLAQGKIDAHRLDPQPAVHLRLLLD
jgi:outer membrane lipoprotein LolB